MRSCALRLFVFLVAAGAGCSGGGSGDQKTCASDGLTCSGHGTCTDAGGAPACVCDAEHSGATCDACSPGHQDNDGATGAAAVYLYEVGSTLVTDMGGSRPTIDAWAEAALPGTLPGAGAT